MSELVSEWEENIMGKGENAGHQHFLLFQQYFQKPSSLDLLKLLTVLLRVNKTKLFSFCLFHSLLNDVFLD